jgi:ribosomal protein S18 acetylase RimI-like enzyme
MGVDPILHRVFEGFLRPVENAERMPWGWLVSDTRFPHLYDLNCAFVTDGDPSIADVEAVLMPALRRTAVEHEHIQMLAEFPGLVEELEARGDDVGWDTWMIHEDPMPEVDTGEVEEVTDLDEVFWTAERRMLQLFEVKSDREVDEYVAFEHLLAQQGKRWFAIRREGNIAAMAALQVFGEVSHVDNVATFEAYRGQGLASAAVTMAVQEAAGTTVTLFTATEEGAASLYERLGFRDRGRIPSLLKALG